MPLFELSVPVCCSCVFFVRRRRPPRTTRTDTRFPYPALFRSIVCGRDGLIVQGQGKGGKPVERTMSAREIGEHGGARARKGRSEEHTSELQSLMRISYAVFCLNKKKSTQRRQARD